MVQKIEISSEKLANIVFSQLKSTISGKVQCLIQKECEDLTIVLKSGTENEVIVKVKGKNVKYFLFYFPVFFLILFIGGVYSVRDMYPGTYEVRILSNRFCWESNTQNVVVDSEKVEIPHFVQKGYTVVFVSSHDTQVFIFVK